MVTTTERRMRQFRESPKPRRPRPQPRDKATRETQRAARRLRKMLLGGADQFLNPRKGVYQRTKRLKEMLEHTAEKMFDETPAEPRTGYLSAQGYVMYLGPCKPGGVISAIGDREACGDFRVPGVDENYPFRFGTFIWGDNPIAPYYRHGHWVREVDLSPEPELLPYAVPDWSKPKKLAPWIYPGLSPDDLSPLERPFPHPLPLPMRSLPALRPPPELLLTNQASSASGHPDPALRPPRGLMAAADPQGPPSPPVGAPPHVNSPPGPKVKEKKWTPKGGLGGALNKAVGALTEGGDFIDAVHDALPKGAKAKGYKDADGKYHPPTPYDKLKALYKGVGKMDGKDLANALLNVAKQQIGDKVSGGLAKGAQKGFHAHGLRPVSPTRTGAATRRPPRAKPHKPTWWAT